MFSWVGVLFFIYPLFVAVIERAGVHFCLDVYNGGYLNVWALLSKLGSPAGFVNRKYLSNPAPLWANC